MRLLKQLMVVQVIAQLKILVMLEYASVFRIQIASQILNVIIELHKETTIQE